MKNIKKADEFKNIYKSKDKKSDYEIEEAYINRKEKVFSDRYNSICSKLKSGEEVSLEDINYALEEIIRVSDVYEVETK